MCLLVCVLVKGILTAPTFSSPLLLRASLFQLHFLHLTRPMWLISLNIIYINKSQDFHIRSFLHECFFQTSHTSSQRVKISNKSCTDFTRFFFKCAHLQWNLSKSLTGVFFFFFFFFRFFFSKSKPAPLVTTSCRITGLNTARPSRILSRGSWGGRGWPLGPAVTVDWRSAVPNLESDLCFPPAGSDAARGRTCCWTWSWHCPLADGASAPWTWACGRYLGTVCRPSPAPARPLSVGTAAAAAAGRNRCPAASAAGTPCL